MHEFRVWAPRAKKMAVKIGDATVSDERADETRMVEGIGGRRRGRVRTMRFCVDDDPQAYPDPRATVAAAWSAWSHRGSMTTRRLRGAMSGWQGASAFERGDL